MELHERAASPQAHGRLSRHDGEEADVAFAQPGLTSDRSDPFAIRSGLQLNTEAS